jgi:hypothetical protein
MARSNGVDFNEAAWPCPALFSSEYEKTCGRGLRRMMELRVVICGLARDVGNLLPRTIARIARLGSLFADSRVVIYENDSQDDTLRQLRAWEAEAWQVTTLSETLGWPHWGPVNGFRNLERAQQMAYYRNQYRQFALRVFSDFDYVLVLDTDVDCWSHKGLANSFGHDGWDMMGSNGLTHWKGRPIYYDTWAFRTQEHPQAFVRQELSPMVFPRGTPPLPVTSCFGGMAVYRMEAMKASEYGGDDCEHVVLHRQMASAGFGCMYMNPSMIVLYPDFEIMLPDSPATPWWI